MKKLFIFILISSSIVFFSSCSKDTKDTKTSKDTKETKTVVNTADFFKAVHDNEPAKVKDYLEKDKTLVDAVDSSSGINESALGISTFDGYKEITEMLLKAGAKTEFHDAYGITPMMGAARTNRVEIIKMLIDNKADVNSINTSKETPLHYAARYNNPDVVKLLLENKADKTAKDYNGQTPYEVAKKENADKVLDLLK
ncbi:MAG: ankyrin repeat domain-containing protein [Ignavibacteriae bacterium]|nr:MAG: ankyrin repeat domain-containing protein [Ignavibacteriota bacterium]